MQSPTRVNSYQWRGQPKIWWKNILNSSKQQYFLWETASQTTERHEILEILMVWAPLAAAMVHLDVLTVTTLVPLLARFGFSCLWVALFSVT